MVGLGTGSGWVVSGRTPLLHLPDSRYPGEPDVARRSSSVHRGDGHGRRYWVSVHCRLSGSRVWTWVCDAPLDSGTGPRVRVRVRDVLGSGVGPGGSDGVGSWEVFTGNKGKSMLFFIWNNSSFGLLFAGKISYAFPVLVLTTEGVGCDAGNPCRTPPTTGRADRESLAVGLPRTPTHVGRARVCPGPLSYVGKVGSSGRGGPDRSLLCPSATPVRSSGYVTVGPRVPRFEVPGTGGGLSGRWTPGVQVCVTTTPWPSGADVSRGT